MSFDLFFVEIPTCQNIGRLKKSTIVEQLLIAVTLNITTRSSGNTTVVRHTENTSSHNTETASGVLVEKQ